MKLYRLDIDLWSGRQTFYRLFLAQLNEFHAKSTLKITLCFGGSKNVAISMFNNTAC